MTQIIDLPSYRYLQKRMIVKYRILNKTEFKITSIKIKKCSSKYKMCTYLFTKYIQKYVFLLNYANICKIKLTKMYSEILIL